MPLFFFSFLFLLSAAQNVDGMAESGVAILDHMEAMRGEERSNESDFLKTSFHQPTIPTQKLLVSHWKQGKTLAVTCLALVKLENTLQSHFPPFCTHKHAELFAVLEFII